MSSEAPPSVIDTTLQNSTREYQKRQVAKSNMNWNKHVQTFYKSTRIYGFNHVDSMRHISSV